MAIWVARRSLQDQTLLRVRSGDHHASAVASIFDHRVFADEKPAVRERCDAEGGVELPPPGQPKLLIRAQQNLRRAVAAKPPRTACKRRGLNAFVGVSTGEDVAFHETEFPVVFVEV